MYLIKLNNYTNIVDRILKAALVLSISLIPSMKFLVPNQFKIAFPFLHFIHIEDVNCSAFISV